MLVLPGRRAPRLGAGHLGIDATTTGALDRHPRPRVRPDRPDLAGGRDYRAHRAAHHPRTRATPGSPDRGRCTFEGPTSRSPRTGSCIAAGSRPRRPAGRRRSPGVPFHTSDTVMRIDALPERLVIMGFGLHRRGVRARLLRPRQRGVGGRAQHTDAARAGRDRLRTVHRARPRRWDVHLGAAPVRVTATPRGRSRPGRRRRRARRPAARGDGPHPQRRPLDLAGRRDPHAPRTAGRRRRVPAHPGRRGVRARRRQLAVPAQARRQPRVEGRRAQPAASRAPAHRPPVRAVGGVHRTRRSPRWAHRAGLPGRALDYARQGPGLRRRRVRLGDGGRHRVLQGAGRTRHRPAAGRAHHGPGGVDPDPAADPGDVVRARRAHEMATGQYWIHPALPELVENTLLGLDL